MHGEKEGGSERVREREGKRERDGEWDPHNLEREESTDQPIGEGLDEH